MGKVNILGTEYSIEFIGEDVDSRMENNNGFIDTSVKKIFVNESLKTRDRLSKENLDVVIASTLRHEIIHGFLFECGLDTSSWASNEEMVLRAKNPLDLFKIIYDNNIMDVVLSRMAENTKFCERYLEDDEFRKEIDKILLPLVHTRLSKI